MVGTPFITFITFLKPTLYTIKQDLILWPLAPWRLEYQTKYLCSNPTMPHGLSLSPKSRIYNVYFTTGLKCIPKLFRNSPYIYFDFWFFKSRLNIPAEDRPLPETLEESPRSCLCHPESKCSRGLALILMCVMGFGSYFCYDNPGALQVKIYIYYCFLQDTIQRMEIGPASFPSDLFFIFKIIVVQDAAFVSFNLNSFFKWSPLMRRHLSQPHYLVYISLIFL